MPNRTATVEIAKGKNGVQFRLLSSDAEYPDALDFTEFTLQATGLPPLRTRTNVETYGKKLRDALSKHPAVRAELVQMFGARAPDHVNLQFAIATTAAEPYRWETLFNQPDCFLALNGLCSLKRIALGGAGTGTGLRIFSQPIRMLAFLSPSGVSSEAEFETIKAAVGAARQQGLAIEATIYLGEQALLDKAAVDAGAGALQGIRVAPIPANAIAIEKALLEGPVQILHFFCHGYAKAEVQLLEFASISDHDKKAPSGSIYLSAERLKQVLSSLNTVWLTVLSSCSSAQEVPGLFSMAGGLTKSGSPVTVGMAEPIQSGDANLFANAFYGHAFNIICNAVKDLPVGSTSMIDLGPAVDHARAQLYLAAQNASGETFGRWCLPVLYERYTPLRVGRAVDDEMHKRVALVAHSLQNLSSNTPRELRDQVLAVLERPRAVPPGLRPDRFGNFP
jgi:hypothetical protein